MVKAGDWLIYALISSLLYGLWGFLSKLATNYIDPKSALVYETIGGMLVGLVVLRMVGFRLQVDSLGILYALLVGVFGMVATLFFIVALSKGPVSVVLTITAVYPVVSILLAFLILKEPITFRQFIGIALAIVAIVLCSKN